MVILGGSRAAAALLSFLAVMLLARAVAPATLGQWSMLLAAQGYALHVAECGLRSVVTAEGGRVRGGPRALLPAYLALRLMLASAVVAVLLAGTWWLRPDLAPAMALVLTSLVAIALQLDWLALLRERPVAAGLLLLVRPAAWLALLALFGTQLDLVRLASLFASAWMLAALATWPLLRGSRAVPGGDEPAPRPRQLLALGWPLAVVTLASQLQISADLVAVGSVLGAAEAGHYYLAAQIAVAATVFANAAGQLGLARLGAVRHRPADFATALRGELAIATRLGLAVALVVGLVPPLALPLLLGETWRGAVTILPWLLPWLVLFHPANVLQAALTAARRQRTVLRVNLLGAAALGVLLVPALATGRPEACALARGLAEAVRLVLLLRAAGTSPFGAGWPGLARAARSG